MEHRVLYKFWAPWCGPCKQLSTTMQGLNFDHLASIIEINVDENPEAAAEHGIMGVPTLLLHVNGKEIARKSGAMSAVQLMQFTQQ